VDRYSGRSMVDSRPGQGGALAGAWRAAATEDRSSPRKGEKREGMMGSLTEGFTGWCDGEERPAAERKKWRRFSLDGEAKGKWRGGT
jgi:hypothetical protein